MRRSAIPHHDDVRSAERAGGSLYAYGDDIITGGESSVPTRREGERTRARAGAGERRGAGLDGEGAREIDVAT